MDINKLLKGITCSCGRIHTCDIEYVYIEKDATQRLKGICEKYHNILVVADRNTFSAAGEKTLASLTGKNIKKVIFDGDKVVVPDEVAIKTVEDNLEGIDIIIGIGSGVIQDLCKYVSFYNKLPYIIVATAPSMDGYASNGAAMITGGMKVTYPAGLPVAIIADTEVLKNAPIEMIKSGYGDIIGKFSALNDWKLSHLINGEYFCDYIYDLTYQQVNKTIDLAQGILKRDNQSIKTLMEALVVIGIMMSFATSSRPASGSEHHLSHFFEITGILNGEEYFPHGIDVGYSTVITAMIRQKLLTNSFPKTLYRLSQKEYINKIEKIYSSSANGIIKLQQKTGLYKSRNIFDYLNKESEIKQILKEMPSPEKIENLLSLVELNTKDFYSLYSKEKIKDAVLYSKDLKDRYTVLWLYYDLLGGETDE